MRASVNEPERVSPAPPPVRPHRVREPIPWVVLVAIAATAVALVATSAARIYRFDAAEVERQRQWRIEHQARLREVDELARVP